MGVWKFTPQIKLEELRVLVHIRVGERRALQTVLVDPPILRDLMRTPLLRPFTEPCRTDHDISAVSEERARLYLGHYRPEAIAARRRIIMVPPGVHRLYTHCLKAND